MIAGPATVNFTGSGGTIGVDLGACSNPPVLQLQKNVVNRQSDTDQFNLSITGGGLSSGNTATTTGTATGVQSAKAGPVLGTTDTTYTFAETGAGTTTMANYTTTYQCVDQGQNNLVVASGNTQSFNFTLPPPAPTETGQFIACTFTNSAPRLVVSKSVVPPSNTFVNPGQSLTYTLTFDNSGGGQPATVNYTDNLTQVLDDATVTTPPALATGTGLTVGPITNGTFPVTGTLATGATATVTYTVTVNNPDTGDHQLVNFVVPTGTSPPPTCLSTNPACTINFVAATPGFNTTILPPSATAVGNPWGDTAIVAGNATGGPPTGTVSWTLCRESAPSTPCTGGTSIGSTGTSTTSGNNSTFTLPNPQTPTVGTWCFNASFASTPGGHYLSVAQQTGTECFSVTPATSSSKTTASPASVVIGPTGTATDSVTVTGNATGGAPTGTVAFTVCGPLPRIGAVPERHRGAADAGELEPRNGDHLERHLGHLHADLGRHLVLRGRLHAGDRVQLHGFERQRLGHGRSRRVLQRQRGHTRLHHDDPPAERHRGWQHLGRHGHGRGQLGRRASHGHGQLDVVQGERTLDPVHRRDRHRLDQLADSQREQLDVHLAHPPDPDSGGHLLLQRVLRGHARWATTCPFPSRPAPSASA